ncbi:LAGLIDADG family homing endonuclease [Natronoarchaeum rubrum]|uniref:LAGLIDADG family homing endonuclease n=1 Tax=Natronoarchaeum rubrum TaxID=755311 RepID=UPI002112ACAA|nr:LAGLIDADG family homing endonuclease [Natronoarchaeum rubrum]
MARAENTELVDSFEQFYRNYYREEIGQLAQNYPGEQRSLHVDWQDLYKYDPDLADDYLSQPEQLQEYAEEALRIYDLPVDVSLGRAHVRVHNLPETTEIRQIRSRHVGKLLGVQGIIRKATDVRPKIEEAAFECQRCGTLTYIPQSSSDFQEPHECQGCERQGPFNINFDQSEFVDAQRLRVQESPEGLRGGETPQSVDVTIEDDVTGQVTPGDHVTVTGILHLQQQGNDQEKSPIFDVYMEGVSVEIEDEEFEDMEISEEEKAEIVELSNDPDIYEKMIASMAPSIYGYDQEKLAIILQLFSGVTKHLPDGSRIRGDLHMLLIGDPGTGKCVKGDTNVTLADGRERPIKEIVEANLEDPKPVDDGVYDTIDQDVVSLGADGSQSIQRATKVWKREAPEQMYRIRTSSGYEVEVTPSHPLFTPGNGGIDAVRAGDLSEGAFVATPREISTTPDDTLDVSYRRSQSNNAVRLDLPDEWTPWLARLVGYVIAEGYVEQRDDNTGFVSITNNDREILDDVARAYDRLGLNYFEREPHEGKEAREIICTSGEFVSFLSTLDPSILCGSADQRVPSDLMQTSSATKAEFVRALIDAEGHVSAKEREITVASMSRELLENVRSLLLSLGITSQLAPRQNGSYRLRISGPQFGRFVDQIGFVTDRKSAAAQEYAETSSNTNRDVVPIDGDELRETRNDLGLTQSECGIPRTTYQHYERGSRNPSRGSLQSVVDAFERQAGAAETFTEVAADGGTTEIQHNVESLRELTENGVLWDRIESIEAIDPEYDWVYDLEVAGTHSYLSNNIYSHNSQLLQYVREISPRSVYTSGKGSSAAGLTAAAVRDDFGDGQQWTLEAGALVLADKGIAAVDELDKMDASDRSAMHEGLEQQSISVSKAGINATLKSRCSLLGAANPKYGRFDQYEPIGEQIDLEPALISRFDLIFTVTDQPDEEEDARLAEHIIQTNFAGELNTQRNEMATPDVTREQVDAQTEQVEPAIEADLLRKYVAHAKSNVFPTMTEEARDSIQQFYVDLRSKGTDEDAPVPVTARKLEALVRLAEASARVRLSDTVEAQDADRVIEIVRSCLQDIGVDPETGQFDADVVETGQSKTQRDRIKNIKQLIADVEEDYEDGAPVDVVMDRVDEIGMDQTKAEREIEKLKQKGEVYEPNLDHLRTA